MNIRGLRPIKKQRNHPEDRVVETSCKNSNSDSLTPSRKGFRRRIPPHVIVRSPLKRLSLHGHNSMNRSMKEMSTLTTDEETSDENGSLSAYVTPEKDSSNHNSTPWVHPPHFSLRYSNTKRAEGGEQDLGLVDHVVDWWSAANALVTSPEMQRFLQCSGHVVVSVSGIAVKTAFLPITLPFHVANKSTGFVIKTCVMPVVGVLLLLQNHDRDDAQDDDTTLTTSPSQSVREGEDDRGEHQNLIVKAARGVWGLPGHAFGFANHVKDEVGGIVLRTLAPTLKGSIHESCQPGESTCETKNQINILERLRLDYPEVYAQEKKKLAEISHFLVRVDDLNVKDEDNGLVHYVDLGSMDDAVVATCMERFVYVGISLLANHPTVRVTNVPYVVRREHEIEWRPEGNTTKRLKRLSGCDTLSRLDILRKETLIWSGRFQHDRNDGYDRQSRFYLARGILNMSPRAMLDLLWDNSRTSDYNMYCVRRNTLAGNDLEFLEGEDKVGTKIIESETRVPLTSISVTLKCLMHARALPDNTGYIIVSRSCTSGPQGVHYGALGKNGGGNKNEILWGVNILRRIPNRENLVDLTSHSQMGTAGVPQFLASKIALMGVEGFFENARKLSI